MTSQKQGSPSLAYIISVLSIALYCAGFLRIEFELNDYKKRIEALEYKNTVSGVATKAPSSDPAVSRLIRHVPGTLN